MITIPLLAQRVFEFPFVAVVQIPCIPRECRQAVHPTSPSRDLAGIRFASSDPETHRTFSLKINIENNQQNYQKIRTQREK